jgi:hypothetical protein
MLLRVLVAADHVNERVLYARTIVRKFPAALVAECDLAAVPRWSAGEAQFDAVVLHFNGTPEAHAAVAAIRRWPRALPVIGLSGVDRGPQAIAAGVTRFLLADQWLMLGPVLGEEVERQHLRRDSRDVSPAAS